MFHHHLTGSAANLPRDKLMTALSLDGRKRAESLLHACPAHTPTPLHSLPVLAQRTGVGSIFIKDEGQRLGLKSFKALGGAYAVMRLMLEEAQRQYGMEIDPRGLQSPKVRAVARSMTVACATDGNHGRSVAAGARLTGCACVIFVHGGVSDERVAAIAAFGAHVVRVDGSYDDSVTEAARQAETNGWIVVSDTSWEGYEDIPLTVMQGYTIMAGEAFDAMPQAPTHIFVQAGVGGVAAAVAAHARARYGAAFPKIIVVEPERADCLFASAVAGKLTKTDGHEPTVMGMLECHEPSPIAWEILSRLAAGFVTLPEQAAIDAMRILAQPGDGDPAIVSGESGCAGLAGLIAAAGDMQARLALGLDGQSRVLLINSEGATDLMLYLQYVGLNPEDVK
jgi:diaminopropionate ammonia-lyase